MYMEWFVHETKGNRGISRSIYKTINVEKSLDKPQVDKDIDLVDRAIKHHNKKDLRLFKWLKDLRIR
jgi:hypothetical protein